MHSSLSEEKRERRDPGDNIRWPLILIGVKQSRVPRDPAVALMVRNTVIVL